MIEAIIHNYANRVEAEINRLFPESTAEYAAVTSAARYSLLLGGKRIRPIIVLEFCRLCGGKEEAALAFAVALEMIHTYSLIHDDLPCMDNDDMRRGKPSCHKKFGEDTALLAGDTLLTRAFFTAASADISPECRVKAIERLAFYAGDCGMIGGQVLDLRYESVKPTAEQLFEMYSMKTGALLKAAAELGCIAAGAGEEEIKNAVEYAHNLGLCFQVIDDILDCTADEALLGKPVGSDEKNSKTTAVTLFGLEKAKQLAATLTEKALHALDGFSGDTAELRELTKYLLNRKF